MRLSFTVPAEPVAMPRPRVAVRGGRPHGYTPPHAAQAQWEIRQRALAAMGGSPPMQGPLRVTVTAWLRQPASIAKRDRLTALPTRRPDVDNFAKTVLDGCSPLWLDDAQVVDLVARKRYAVDAAPRWEISVDEADNAATASGGANPCHCAGLHGSGRATDALEAVP